MLIDVPCPRCGKSDVGTHSRHIGRDIRYFPVCLKCDFRVQGETGTRAEAFALWLEDAPGWASRLDHVRSDGTAWDGPAIAPDRWARLDAAAHPRDGSPFWTTDCEVIVENTWLPGTDWLDCTEIDGELFNASYWAPL